MPTLLEKLSQTYGKGSGEQARRPSIELLIKERSKRNEKN